MDSLYFYWFLKPHVINNQLFFRSYNPVSTYKRDGDVDVKGEKANGFFIGMLKIKIL